MKITITYKGEDYTLTPEDVDLSPHDLSPDQILQSVGKYLGANLEGGYQVLRNGDVINITPYAIYGGKL